MYPEEMGAPPKGTGKPDVVVHTEEPDLNRFARCASSVTRI